MRIVLIGPPGSGKGTQATRVADHYRIPRISVTGLLRQASRYDEGPGPQARPFLDKGHPVPDEITIEVLRERLQLHDVQSGFLMVGFPHTTAQALLLDDLLGSLAMPVEQVLLLDGDADHFMERLEGRRICRSCGAAYNVFSNPPRVEGVCDGCGGRLRRRGDDNEDTIASRMRVFEHQTAPLIHYYRLQEILRQINADAGEDEVFQGLCARIGERPPAPQVSPDREPSPPIEKKKASGKKLTGVRKKTTGGRRAPSENTAATTKGGGKKRTPAKKAAITEGASKSAKKVASKKKTASKRQAPVAKKVTSKKAAKKATSKKKAPVSRKKKVPVRKKR